MEAVGGVGPTQGHGTGGGLLSFCGFRVVTGVLSERSLPSEAGGCAAAAEGTQCGQGTSGRAHGLLREHRHRGRHAAPAGHPQAGPARGG